MATLKDLLPAPTDGFTLEPEEKEATATTSTAVAVVPGKPCVQAGVSKVLTIAKGENGEVDYSAIVRQGENASRTVHTGASALVEKSRDQALNPVPGEEDVAAATARTRAALQQVVNGKIAASKTTDPGKLAEKPKPSFVRYTPANTNSASAWGPRQRIIKMAEAPVDPMLPPKFAHRKAPVNPPSPPVPVMHSPERKLSKKEAENWKIPPVVSNWKNNRGYTISLEKRLAADGRASQDHSINDRFADLASALYKTENSMRVEVAKRAELEKKVTLRAKEAKERELREFAERARRQRKGYLGLSDATDTESQAPSRGFAPSEAGIPSGAEEYVGPPMGAARPVRDDLPPTLDNAAVERPIAAPPRRPRKSRFSDMPPPALPVSSGLREEHIDDEAVRRRDQIRQERREARERELRGREAHGDESTAPTLKRSKLSRDQDRDLAERVALGQSAGGGRGGSEQLYDQRLFNQAGSGGKNASLAGGYGPDDAYTLYDKPLFNTGSKATSSFQYRPPRTLDGSEEDGGRPRFRPDKGFGGSAAASGGAEAAKESGYRDRAVEFEKDTDTKAAAASDPYGLDKFCSEAKQFEKKAS